MSAALREFSWLLRYPRWVQWCYVATLAASIMFVALPIYSLSYRIAAGREEKEWFAVAFLVLSFGFSAIYMIRHLRGMFIPVKVSAETLAHDSTRMNWSDVTSVWDSAFFSTLRIKDRNGQVLTFFLGLDGYTALAALAKAKLRANRVAQRNSDPSNPLSLLGGRGPG